MIHYLGFYNNHKLKNQNPQIILFLVDIEIWRSFQTAANVSKQFSLHRKRERNESKWDVWMYLYVFLFGSDILFRPITFKKYLLSILKDTILNFKSMIPCQFLSFLDQQDIWRRNKARSCLIFNPKEREDVIKFRFWKVFLPTSSQTVKKRADEWSGEMMDMKRYASPIYFRMIFQMMQTTFWI